MGEKRATRRRLVGSAVLAAMLAVTTMPLVGAVSAAPGEELLEPDSANPMAPNDATSAPTAAGSERDALTAAAATDAGTADIISLQPARVLETRPGLTTADGQQQLGRRLAAGSTTEIPIAGRVGVAPDAQAVVVYATAVFPSAPGFLTLFPCGDRPVASSLNHVASTGASPVVVGNEVVAKLSAAGSVCVFTRAEADLTFDVVGFVPASSPITSIDPVRMLETRPGERTFDGRSAAGGTIGPDEVAEIQIAGRGEVPNDAAAAVINVTAVFPSAPGFLTMFPCGDRPTASSLNYFPGGVVGNELIVKLNDAGAVCVYSRAETDLTFDVVGYVPASGYVPLDPARLLETRPGEQTADGRFQTGARFAAGSTTEIEIAGRAGVPDDATAAVLNVTVVSPSAPGFFTVFPCGDRPTASSLNYFPGDVRANEIVAKLSDTGTVCVFTRAETDALFDVVGAVTAPDSATATELSDLRYEPGWRFEPATVMFDAAGQTRSVELVHYGADGRPSGRAVPDGLQLQQPDGLFAITADGPGRWSVSGDGVIGTELVSADITSGERLSFWVSGVRVKSGVEVIPDDRVLVPPPEGAEVGGVEPFTTAEFEARTLTDPQGTIRLPYVIVGEAPPAGALLAGRSIYGRVTEPTGLPSIERDGLALVSLELVPVDVIFQELNVDVDYEDLADRGLIPSRRGAVFCSGTDLEAIASDPECGGASSDASRRSATIVREPFGVGDRISEACEADLGAKIGEHKFKIAPSYDVAGKFNTIVTGGSLQGLQVTGGVTGSLTASFEGKLQATFGVGVDCRLWDLVQLELPIPSPIDLIVQAIVDPGINVAGELEVGAGEKIEYKIECSTPIRGKGGIRWLDALGFTVVDDTDDPLIDCGESQWPELSGGDGTIGTPFQLEFKPGIFLNAKSGLKLGGRITSFIEFLLAKEDLGEVTPIELNAGPRIEIGTENRASTFEAKETGSSASLNFVATIGLDTEEFTGFFGKLGDLNLDFALPTLEFNVELLGLVTPPTAGAEQRFINGEEKPAGTLLAADDEVRIEFPVEKPDDFLLIPVDFTGEFESFEIVDGSGTVTDLISWSYTGGAEGKATASFTVDDALCRRLKSGVTIRTIGSMSDSTGLVTFPGYLGDVTLKCGSLLEFDPAEIALSKVDDEKTVTIRQEGLTGQRYDIAQQSDPGDGSTVSISPMSAVFENDPLLDRTSDSVELTVELDCLDTTSDPAAEHLFIAGVDGASLEEVPLLLVKTNCTDDFVDIVEETIIVPNRGSASFSLTSEGTQDDEWTGVGRPDGPDGRGTLKGSESTTDVVDVLSGTIQGRDVPILPARCNGTPGEGDLPREEVVAQLTTSTRGGDSVTLIYPEHVGFPPEDGVPCPPPDPPGTPPCIGCGGSGGSGGSGGPGGSGGSATGGGWGDPHMISFDGATYDAQTLGEYVYAEPVPGEPGPRVIARHEFTAPSPFAATSITAVAVELGDRTLELYGRPVAVRVDGVPTDLTIGSSLDLGDDLLVTRTAASSYRVDHPELSMVAHLGLHIDVEVTVAADGTYVGHLGVADGDPSNDLVVRDVAAAVGAWTTFLLDDVRRHGDELYEIAGSWRLTDLTDSPFSIPSDAFDTPNPGRPGTETLAPFREIAEERLGLLSSMCTADTSDGSYAVDVFAIELALGLDPLPATCTYVVVGNVTTDAPAAAVGGATVVVDGEGLTECTTTTTVIGNYRCELSVDLDELGGSPAAFPLTVDVEVTAPEGAGPSGSGAGSFTERPAFDGRSILVLDDITVPVDSVSLVRLNGRMTRNGAPITVPGRFAIRAAGTPATVFDIGVTPDVSGDFEVLFVVPPSSPSTTVSYVVGLPGDVLPSITLGDLTTGVNDRSFEPAYDPVELTVNGDATVNGSAAIRTPLRALATRADGSTVQLNGVIEPDGAGAYSAALTMPLGAVSVELSAQIGHPDEPRVSVVHDLPASGPHTVPFDLVLETPRLDLTGQLRRNAVSPAVVLVTIDWASSTAIGRVDTSVAPNAIDGSITGSVVLPSIATSATVTAQIGQVPADHVVVEAPELVDGSNVVDIDGEIVTPVLDVTGTITGGAVGVSDPFDLSAVTPDGFSTSVSVTPEPDGSYVARIELPGGTTEVTLTAEVGDSTDDWGSTSPSGLVDGSNPVTFDVAFDAVAIVATGALTLDGQPLTGSVVMRFIARDGGTEVAVDDVSVVADGLGRYETTVVFPAGVDEVAAFARYGPFPTLRVPIVRTGLINGRNDVTIDDDVTTTTIQVSGDFPSPPRWFAGPFTLEAAVEFTRPDGTTDSLDFRPGLVASNGDGSYATTIAVPESSTSVDLLADLGDAVDPPPTLADQPISRGDNPIVFSENVDIGVRVEIDGLLFDAGGAFEGDASIRYVTRDQGGQVVDDETVDVTTSALGAFQLDVDTLSSVGSIDVAWLVGVDGEDPTFTSVDGLVVGTNQIDVTDVYDPPIVEVSGVVTRNGQPLTGDVTIDLAVTGGTENSIQLTATPDGSGAFSATRTLQRAATEVDVSVSTSDADDGGAQAVDVSLAAGANPIGLDLEIERTNLQVSGTMSLAGSVPAGPVDVNLTVSGDGFADRSVTVPVDVAPGTGAYSYEIFLPHWASSVEAEYEIGALSEDWPVTVFDTLLVGDDARVFDAIADVRLLDIDGTFTIGATPYTKSWRLGLRYERSDGSFISTTNVTIPASPDGAFALEVEPPQAATTVRLLVYPYVNFNLAADQEDFAIVDGVNDIDFEAFTDEVGLILSGQLLEEGQFDTDGRPLTVRYYTDDSSNFVERTWSTGDSDDEGRYETTLLTLPPETIRVEIGSNNTGQLENDEIFQSYDVVYGLNEIVFDEDYVPLRVTISGNMQRDGAPITQQTSIEWTWRQLFPPNGVFPQRRNESVVPDANGDYSLVIIGPRNADEIGPVEAKVGVTFEDYPSIGIRPVTVGADNQVELNVDYVTTSVTISGEIEYDGEVPAQRNIDIYMFDADGRSLGERNALAVPSDLVTGAYLIEDVTLASATTEMRMEFLFGGRFSQPFERSTITVPITPGSTDNTATFSFKTTSIEVTGNLTQGTSPVANDFRDLTFMASDGVTDLGGVTRSISTDSNGDYSVTAYLPAGTTEVEITANLDGSTPVTITGLATPGVTTGMADFVGNGGDGLTITGMVLDNGAALPDVTPTFNVTIYDDGDFGDGPFGVSDVLSEGDLDPDTFVDGAYSLFVNTDGVDPTEIDFVQVDIDIGYTYAGGQSTYTKVFDLRFEDAPYTLTYDVDAAARQIIYGTESYILDLDAGEDCAYTDSPFVHRLTMFAYDGDSGDPGSNEIGTFTSVMIPDPSGFGNDHVPVVWSPPAGTADVVYEIDTTPFYDSDIAEAFYAFGYPFGTRDYSGIVSVDSYDEADCEPGFGGDF